MTDRLTPAHANYHRLAFERFQSLLEVLDNVLCDELQTFFGSDDSFKLRPLGLELFPALNSKSESIFGRSLSSSASSTRPDNRLSSVVGAKWPNVVPQWLLDGS
jgi:hypothetical protein